MTLRQFAERLQRRSVEDAKLVAGVVATIVAAVLAHRLDLFDRFYDISRAHEDLQLDEIVPMALIVLLSVAWLRARQLRNEVARRETAEQQAHALARHDPLTGLANRRVLAEYLDSAQQRLADTQRELAVLVVDLDRFKPVNDLHGHAGGDLVLRQVSTRLAEVLHAAPGSLLARLGGDEFACVIDYAPHSDAPLRIAKQIVSRIAEPFLVDGSNVQIGASVGIALCTDGATDPDQLLRAADIAMYGAKRDGRSTFRSYEPSMDAELRLRGALEDELRQGLARGEVIPFYQPITRLPSGQLVGFEALARWANPHRGEISPEVFIPIAEDAGLIDQITTAILSRACIDARDWPPHLSLSINIAPIQLKNRWLSARLLQIITEGGFAAGRLIVEITENGLVGDYDAAREIIASLKNAGVQIALDDFGTGYSSLSHLRELQFDRIKIDGSFVRDLENFDNGQLVKAIIGLGASLGIAVTAEGIETQAGFDILSRLGCGFGQGYLTGRPMSAAEVREGKWAGRKLASPGRARRAGRAR